MAVLLPITGVGETSVAAIKFALEGLLTWSTKKVKYDQKIALFTFFFFFLDQESPFLAH